MASAVVSNHRIAAGPVATRRATASIAGFMSTPATLPRAAPPARPGIR
jgi:hypothetical protein